MRRLRTAALATAAAVALGAVVAFGDGNQAQDVRLLSGAAWLASPKAGQVTLLDGASAEVAAQVQIATPGSLIEVVQQGSTAYAVDQSAGTVRRVDGATFELTPPEAPIADVSTGGLTAIAGRTALYTVDTKRGILADTDPRTLERRGEMIGLAGELRAGTATVDDAGTLWAVNTGTGDLHRVAGQQRSQWKVTEPGPGFVTIANGHPVVVDVTGRRVVRIDRDGAAAGSIALDLRKEDTLQVSGSPHNERLYLVLGRGALSVCDLTAGQCDKVIPLAPGNDFGAAVETGNRLFLPNYSTGEVWILDLAQSRVVARAPVLRAGRFQLLTRDGVVFYNDTSSEKAGVVTLDGTVTPAAKYDPSDPSKGTNRPVDNDSEPSGQEPTQQPNPAQVPVSGQNPDQRPTQPTSPTNTNPAQPTQPSPTTPTQPTPANPPSERDQPDQPDPPPAQLQITMSDLTPTVDQPIELKVENTSSAPPADVQWTFGDTGRGTGLATSHKWAREGSFQVSLTAVMPDGRPAAASIGVTVAPRPTVKLKVRIPSGGGRITGGGVNCPGTCEVSLEPGTGVTLDATPAAGRELGTWAGCTGTPQRCNLVVDQEKTVSYTFGSPKPKVTLTVTRPTSGTVTGDTNCPGPCAVTVDEGTQVQVVAKPNEGFSFDGWGGACAGQAETCRLTLTRSQSVSVVFKAIRPILTVQLSDAGLGDSVTVSGRRPCVGGTCTYELAYKETVHLNAVPGPGRSFVFWGRTGGLGCRTRPNNANRPNCVISPTKNERALAYFMG
ncbi:MAG: PKD domain-containing protein [Kibdelosporangium sp.]